MIISERCLETGFDVQEKTEELIAALIEQMTSPMISMENSGSVEINGQSYRFELKCSIELSDRSVH